MANMTLDWISEDVICMRHRDRMTEMMFFSCNVGVVQRPRPRHIECAQNAKFYAPTKDLKKEFWS